MTGLADPGEAGRGARPAGRARLDAISTTSRSTSTARTSRSCRSFNGRFDPLGVHRRPARGQLRRHRPAARAHLPQHRPLHARAGLRPVPARRAQLLHPRPARPLCLADAGRDACRAGLSRARRTTRATCWRATRERRQAASRSSPSSPRSFSAWQCPMPPPSCCSPREALAGLFDIDAGLDLLAAQTQPDRSRPLRLPRLHGDLRGRRARLLPARRPGADVGAPRSRPGAATGIRARAH